MATQRDEVESAFGSQMEKREATTAYITRYSSLGNELILRAVAGRESSWGNPVG